MVTFGIEQLMVLPMYTILILILHNGYSLVDLKVPLALQVAPQGLQDQLPMSLDQLAQQDQLVQKVDQQVPQVPQDPQVQPLARDLQISQM